MKKKCLLFLVCCFSFVSVANAGKVFNEKDTITGRTNYGSTPVYQLCQDGNCTTRSLYKHKITSGKFENLSQDENDYNVTRILCLDAGLQGMSRDGNTTLYVAKVFTPNSPLLIDRAFLYIINANRSAEQGGNYNYYSRVVAARALQAVSKYYANYNVVTNSTYFDGTKKDMQGYANMAAKWLNVSQKSDPSFYHIVNTVFGPLDTLHNDNYIDTDHDGVVDFQDIENHLIGWVVAEDYGTYINNGTTKTNIGVDVSPQATEGPNHLILKSIDGQNIIEDAEKLFKDSIIYAADPSRVETQRRYVTFDSTLFMPNTIVQTNTEDLSKSVISIKDIFEDKSYKAIDLSSCESRDLISFTVTFHNLGNGNNKPVYVYNLLEDDQFTLDTPLYYSETNDGKNLKAIDSFTDLRDIIKKHEVEGVSEVNTQEYRATITFYRGVKRRKKIIFPKIMKFFFRIEYSSDNNLGEAAILYNTNNDPKVTQRFLIGNYDMYGGDNQTVTEIPINIPITVPNDSFPTTDESTVTAEFVYKCEEKHVCDVVPDKNGKAMYYGKSGIVVDKSTYESECFKCSKPSTNDPNYHGENGAIVDEATWAKQCKCKVTGDTLYDDNGIKVAEKKKYSSVNGLEYSYEESEYSYVSGANVGRTIPKDELEQIIYNINKQCHVCSTPDQSTDGQYHDSDGQPTDQATYANQCTSCEDLITNKSDPFNDPNYKTYLKKCCHPGKYTDGSTSQSTKSVITKCKEAADGTAEKDKWCKLKSYCDICNGTKSVPRACTEFSDSHLVECENNADAIIKDSDKVKTCILDYVDENDNPYEFTDRGANTDNPYCKIYCKEDYKFGLPTGKWTESGKKFTLKVDVSGTKSCYTSKIDTPKFIADLQTLENRILNGEQSNPDVIHAYNQAVSNYNYCTEPVNNWGQKMDFGKQNIYVTYDENYVSLVNNDIDGKDNMIRLSILDETNKQYENSNWYCTGDNADVNERYNKCINGRDYIDSSKITDKIEIKYSCDNGMCKYRDGEKIKKMSVNKASYVSSTSTQSATYAPPVLFATRVLSGTVDLWSKVEKDCKSPEGCNYDDLSSTITVTTGNLQTTENYKDVQAKVGDLPVQLNKTRGAYRFEVLFEGVGEYFNQYTSLSKSGRLLGDTRKVKLTNYDNEFEGNYYCSYVVNCPSCGYSCVPDAKQGIVCDAEPTCNGKACATTCFPNCLYDSSKENYENNNRGYNFSARQISPSNINPTNRELGINLANEKGQTFMSDVQKTGDVDFDKVDNGYEITFDRDSIMKIREYNRNHLKDGGFASSEMNCKTITPDGDDNHSYSDCTDEFVREMAQKGIIKIHESNKNDPNSTVYNKQTVPYNGVIGNGVGPAYR